MAKTYKRVDLPHQYLSRHIGVTPPIIIAKEPRRKIPWKAIGKAAWSLRRYAALALLTAGVVTMGNWIYGRWQFDHWQRQLVLGSDAQSRQAAMVLTHSGPSGLEFVIAGLATEDPHVHQACAEAISSLLAESRKSKRTERSQAYQRLAALLQTYVAKYQPPAKMQAAEWAQQILITSEQADLPLDLKTLIACDEVIRAGRTALTQRVPPVIQVPADPTSKPASPRVAHAPQNRGRSDRLRLGWVIDDNPPTLPDSPSHWEPSRANVASGARSNAAGQITDETRTGTAPEFEPDDGPVTVLADDAEKSGLDEETPNEEVAEAPAEPSGAEILESGRPFRGDGKSLVPRDRARNRGRRL